MSLWTFCRSLHAYCTLWVNSVWPADAHQLTQAEIARLSAALSRRYSRLVERRAKIEKLREKLARLRHSQSHSLRIHRLQQQINSLELAYARNLAVFHERKRLHRDLLIGKVIAVPEGA